MYYRVEKILLLEIRKERTMEFSTWATICQASLSGIITFVAYWVGYHIGYGKCKQDYNVVDENKKITTEENKCLTTE